MSEEKITRLAKALASAGYEIVKYIKNNVEFSFIIFNLLLSVIGIFAAMVAVKIEQYDSPFLYALPLSNVLWVFFGFFAKTPNEKYTEEELEAMRKPYSLREVIIKELIFAIGIIIILSDLTMMLFISMKTTVVPAVFPP